MSDLRRKLLVNIYVYRTCAILFACAGGVFYMALYYAKADADYRQLIADPVNLIWLVLPFIPSAAFFFMAGMKEKKLNRLDETPGNA